MKLVLFGIGGMVGSRIAQEALNRGHQLTAVVRDPHRVSLAHERLKVIAGDVLDPANVATVASGHDAVLSAVGPGKGQDPQMLVQVARSLIEGLKRAGVRRLVVIGGAGSLEVKPGLQLVDTPNFPAAYLPLARAHRDAFEVYRTADLDWTSISPPRDIEPGVRTGHFRTGTDQLLTDEMGESRISAEDYAVAFLDEVEKPKSIRKCMTVAY
jgi:uncharacterized protein